LAAKESGQAQAKSEREPTPELGHRSAVSGGWNQWLTYFRFPTFPLS